ncbi:hypothetical protein SARC_13089, partial [Sphaeroforma arctica JP610]
MSRVGVTAVDEVSLRHQYVDGARSGTKERLGQGFWCKCRGHKGQAAHSRSRPPHIAISSVLSILGFRSKLSRQYSARYTIDTDFHDTKLAQVDRYQKT